METLTLPEPAASLWASKRHIVHAIPPELFHKAIQPHIGGGTILAARWRHRLSTDIDVLLPSRNSLIDLLQENDRNIVKKLDGTAEAASGGRITIAFEHGRLDLSTFPPDPPCAQREAAVDGQPEQVLSTTQILRGKLKRVDQLLVRDVFDILTAADDEPAALATAASMVPKQRATAIDSAWREAAGDLADRFHDEIHASTRPNGDTLGPAAAAAFRDHRYTRLEIDIANNQLAIRKTTAATTLTAETYQLTDTEWISSQPGRAITESGVAAHLNANGPITAPQLLAAIRTAIAAGTRTLTVPDTSSPASIATINHLNHLTPPAPAPKPPHPDRATHARLRPLTSPQPPGAPATHRRPPQPSTPRPRHATLPRPHPSPPNVLTSSTVTTDTKWIIGTLLATTLALAALLSAQIAIQISGINTRVDDLRTELTAQITGVNTRVNDLRTELTTRINRVDNRINGIDTRIDGLANRLRTVETNTSIPAERLPNPTAAAITDWGDVPEHRAWGTTIDVDIDPIDGNIWAYERCEPTSLDPGTPANCDSSAFDPIVKFDRNSGEIAINFGAGIIATPQGIHADDDGNIWVTDSISNTERTRGYQVHKFSPAGELLMSLGTAGQPGTGPNQFNQPNDVITGPDGSIYVADGPADPTADTPSRILKFAPDGTFVTAWGQTGSLHGEFREPNALAFDPTGRLFVADRGNHRIEIFDQDGNYLSSIYSHGQTSGIFITDDRTLYSIDANSATPGQGIRIGPVDEDRITAFIPRPSATETPTYTASIAVDAAGNVYAAAETPNSRRLARGALTKYPVAQ